MYTHLCLSVPVVMFVNAVYMVLVIVCVRIINANCTIYIMCVCSYVCYEITLDAIKEREINIKLKLMCVSFHFVSFQSKSIIYKNLIQINIFNVHIQVL